MNAPRRRRRDQISKPVTIESHSRQFDAWISLEGQLPGGPKAPPPASKSYLLPPESMKQEQRIAVPAPNGTTLANLMIVRIGEGNCFVFAQKTGDGCPD